MKHSTTAEPDNAEFVLALVEAIRDSSVITALKEATKIDYDHLSDMVADKLQHRFRKMQDELDAKEERIKTLEEKVSVLELKQDEAEQYSRRSSVRISGIPEVANEDVIQKVREIFSVMNVSPNINRVHRVGPSNPKLLLANASHPASDQSPLLASSSSPSSANDVLPSKTSTSPRAQPRAILCQFTTYGDKANVMKHSSALKSELPGVFINEDLTRKRAKLFFAARKLKKEKKIADCWTSDGKIVAKFIKNNHSVITQIRSHDDLNQF